MARVGDLEGGRMIYTSLEVAKINTNKISLFSECRAIKVLWLCLGPRGTAFYFTMILQIVSLAMEIIIPFFWQDKLSLVLLHSALGCLWIWGRLTQLVEI